MGSYLTGPNLQGFNLLGVCMSTSSFGLPIDQFLDREWETEQLNEIWNEPGARLVTVWGRRRVGKSTLTGRFAANKRAIYLYGTRVTQQDILSDLTAQLRSAIVDEHLLPEPFSTWDGALNFLSTIASDERLLVVLDEFQFLCEVTPGLDTLVQRWWDRIHQTANIVVIITSSAFSFMQGLTGATGPLHGRRTDQLEISPFDHYDAARFFDHLGAVDRVRAYACLGGIPAYLQFGHVGSTISEIVQRSLFNPRHFLFREGEELLRTEFHQETLYASILRAVAAGETRPSDIARAVGRASADEIFDHLRRLIDLQFLRRDVPITEIHRTRTQRVMYRLADPYLRFWFRYVAPNQSQVQLRRGSRIWETYVAPGFDDFVARTTWEDVCVQHLWRRLASDQLPVEFQRLGRWWDNTDEIDLVGVQDRLVTLVGECKWTNSPVNTRIFDELRLKARKLDTVERPLWVLASRSGFEPEVRQRAEQGDLLLIEPDDLFAPDLERTL